MLRDGYFGDGCFRDGLFMEVSFCKLKGSVISKLI